MEFIKRNILLVLVLVICLAASGLLVYMSYQEQSKVATSLSEVDGNIDELKKLSVKKPSPCEENEVRYLADSKIYKEKAFELQRLFGHPFRAPLQEMAKSLGMTERDLMVKFKDYWNNNYTEDNNSHYHLYTAFLKTLGNKKAEEGSSDKEVSDKEAKDKPISGDVINAVNMFKKTLQLQQQNLEDVDESNLYKFILASLNIPPVEMSPTSCRTYINTMQGKLEKRLTQPEPQELKMGFSRVKLGKGVEKFTLETFDDQLPLPDQIPLIIKHIRALEDLFYRLQVSGVSTVESISRENSIQGDFQNMYQTFTYKLTLNGSLSSIRKFINALQVGYMQNRVYVVRNVTLNLLEDEVKSLSTAGTDSRKTPERSRKRTTRQPIFAPGPGGMPPGAYPPGMMGNRPGMTKRTPKITEKTEIDESKLPPEQRRGYGQALVGNSKNVLAVIEFNYIIYTGENF